MKMNRYKRRERLRRGGCPYKQDTPMKLNLRTKKRKKKLLPSKRYDTVHEEPEVDTSDLPVKPTDLVVSSGSAHCKMGKSVSCFGDPASTGDSRNRNMSPLIIPVNKGSYSHNVSQAGHPSVQVTPTQDTFSSEEDDDNCYSSTSTTLSSLPSPEIFRKENTVEMLTFPHKEKLPDLQIKNSTLLDVSHAENILTLHPPNLSNIMGNDASTILAEKKCENSHHKNPEPESKIEGGDKSLRKKHSPEPTMGRLKLFRKKVWFKSPVTTMTLEAKQSPSSIHTIALPSCPPEQMMTNAKTQKRKIKSEFSSREEALPPRVKTGSEKTKFFDFASDNERDVFFQMMRERCAKLRRHFLFPMALETQNPFVP